MSRALKYGHGFIIKTTGEIQHVTPKDGKKFSLEELQKAVGGLVELSVLEEDGVDFWVNEEGKLIGLDVNPKATALWQHTFGPHDVIVGDVIVTTRESTK